MKKSLVAILLSVCLFISGMPVKAVALNWQQNRLETRAFDEGSYVIGNNMAIQAILEQSKFTARQGHAFAAERGNNLIDQLHGLDATVVGDDNIKNGPDRKILNRRADTEIWIQDKYYSTAKDGIEACFTEGQFRYFDADGVPMQIEVPQEQYDEAVALMREKIMEGRVRGISDPSEAENIVRRGNITYEQAVNLAKAGTIESLKYDAINGVVSASCTFGISTLINYSVCRLDGESKEAAIKIAALEGMKSGSVVFATTVIAGQLAKTSALKIFTPSSEALIDALGTDFAKALLQAVFKDTTGMTTEAIKREAVRVLQNQVLMSGVTIIILSMGDVVELFKGRISTEQLLKNLTVTSAGVIGGVAGSVIGSTAGTAVAPGIGTKVGGVIGGVILGSASGYASEKIISIFIKDDAEKMLSIIENVFCQLCESYLLTEKEADHIVDVLQDELTPDNIKQMYASENKEDFATAIIEPLIVNEISNRGIWETPSEEEMRKELKNNLENVVFIH